jgi:hypothetical protein
VGLFFPQIKNRRERGGLFNSYGDYTYIQYLGR